MFSPILPWHIPCLNTSKSIFTIDVNDKVTIKASFISPLTPKDMKRQSLIASYLKVEVVSKDGFDHDVQLYTDISAGMWSPQINPTTRFRAVGYFRTRHAPPPVREPVVAVVLCLEHALIWSRVDLG